LNQVALWLFYQKWYIAIMAFKTFPEIKPGIIQRLLPFADKQGAAKKLEDFLAGFPHDLQGLDTYRAAQVVRPFRVRWRNHGKALATPLLLKYLRFLWHLEPIPQDWPKQVDRLVVFLGLDPQHAQQLISQEAQGKYQSVVEAYLTDNQLSEEERQSLDRLLPQLPIEPDTAKDIMSKAAETRIEQRLQELTQDERLSPQEIQELKNLAAHFGVELPEERLESKELLRFQFYWYLESGPLTGLELGINLRKGEEAYLSLPVDWYEYRSRTRRINYGGPTARIRIARGIYWSAGSLGVERVSEDYLKLIDSGLLYITNKRLLFMGQKGNKQLPYYRILTYEPFSNGLSLQKDSGPTPFLEMESQVDFATILLDRMLFGAGNADN
jgi:predicted transcriptional regulator